jgi:hypothetical protein
MTPLSAVVTTIQRPTAALVQLGERLQAAAGRLVVAGDRKGPDRFDLPGCEFLGLAWQQTSPYALARILPVGHYARKNIAYLQAIKGGATCLYETDDDNAPGPTWAPRGVDVSALSVQRTGWINVYRCFSTQLIWPRGLPLDEILRQGAATPPVDPAARTVRAPIQQGLADLSPDVDAVWRLVLDNPFTFDRGPSIHLPPGSWCPFNSQSTWWWPEVYPLLYLPSHCSFRMTDIWRSFIAQRCLWELGHGLVFHAPEVVQERNPHDLMRDFQDEVPGYLRNRELVKVLEGLNLQPGEALVGRNMRACYQALHAAGFFPREELELVQAWLQDLESLS